MDKPSLVLIGSGGHAKVVFAAAKASGWHVSSFFDDNISRQGMSIGGVSILGPIAELTKDDFVHIAIGGALVRMKFDELGCQWQTVIHSHAYVDGTVEIGEGSFVAAGAVINPDAVIGRHCIINTSSSVDHDCELGDFVQIAPGAHLGGNVRVGRGSFIGLGASVIQGITIGENATIGAGATIIRDVPNNAKIVGNPGRNLI